MTSPDTPDEEAVVVAFSIVGQGIDAAEEAPPATTAGAGDAAGARSRPAASGGDGRSVAKADRYSRCLQPGQDTPDDFPIVPLGRDGLVNYLLDRNQQFHALTAEQVKGANIEQLFGRDSGMLEHWFPRHSKDGGAVIGWDKDAAGRYIRSICDCGIWDPFERLRGRGAWRGEDGELILHCGDVLLIGPRPGDPPRPAGAPIHEFYRPGGVGRYVYSRRPSTSRPAETNQGGGPGGPASALLERLVSWNWQRGEIDARLLLGWIGAAMIGGALRWRPLAWITGDKETGKTTLQDALKELFDGGIVSVGNATAAGIWQKIQYDTLPVALDELEASADNRRVKAVVELAREAASGSFILRGGENHQGVQFMARSCFAFSSINMPPLTGADVSRMAILCLDPLPKGATLPDLAPRVLRELGGALKARLLCEYGRLEDLLEAYASALRQVGHTNRGADQFGTLLAVADLLLHDGDEEGRGDGERIELWARRLEAGSLAELVDMASDWQRCREHLLSARIEPQRNGGYQPVMYWLERANGGGDEPNKLEAQRVLGNVGLAFVRSEEGQAFLAVANNHNGLDDIFRGTHWAGASGMTNVWVQALRRVPGHVTGNRKIGGIQRRFTAIPVGDLVDERTAEDYGFD